MNPSFTTPEAQEFWGTIPSHFQQRVLNNVWCPHEREMTTIADDFWGEIQGTTLVLHGTCVRCEGRVGRVIEERGTLRRSTHDDQTASIFDEDKREIYLVTTSDNSRPCGMIVTWVTPASLIPEAKRIVLVLSPHSYTTQVLLQQRQFIIHRLSHDQAALVPTFGLYSSREVDKFASISFTLDEGSGMPIVDGTCAWALGNLISQMDAGDRLVLLARLEKETADFTKQSLLVGDLAQHIPVATLQAMQDKYFQDVERDRRISAHPQII